MFEQTGPPPLDKRVVALLILWCMLLPIGLFHQLRLPDLELTWVLTSL